MRAILGVFLAFFMAFGAEFKGVLYYFENNSNDIFALLYENAPKTPLFDENTELINSSYLIISTGSNTQEIELFKEQNHFLSKDKKYKINENYELIFNNSKITGQKLSNTSLSLNQNAQNTQIKRRLELPNLELLQAFRPFDEKLKSYEQIRQRPVFKNGDLLSIENRYIFYKDGLNHAIMELSNLVYDIKNEKLVALDELFDIHNQNFIKLLQEKAEKICDDCFDDLSNLAFNDNFLLTKTGLRICFLPYENHFLDTNLCLDFKEVELKDFKK